MCVYIYIYAYMCVCIYIYIYIYIHIKHALAPWRTYIDGLRQKDLVAFTDVIELQQLFREVNGKVPN